MVVARDNLIMTHLMVQSSKYLHGGMLRIIMGLEAGDERAARTRFSEIKEGDVVVYGV